MTGGRCLDEIVYSVGTGQVAFRIFFTQRAAIAIGIRGEVDAAYRIRICAPHADAGEAHGELRTPMEAIAQCDVFTAACIDRGQQQRALVGLCAGGAEEGFLQFARGDSGKLFGQVYKVFCEVGIADMLQGLYLRADLVRDFRIAVTAIDDGNTGKAVQVLAVLAVIEILHGAADKLAGFLVEMGEAGHDILFLFFYDGLWANIAVHEKRTSSYNEFWD